MKCPFEPRRGYATLDARNEFLLQKARSDPNAEAKTDNVLSDHDLQADATDRSQPLHFWQLYSLIGHKPVVDIVKDFYHRVFDDHEAEWFRSVFVKIGPFNHHVATQAAYWVDAMGGGRNYHGGNYRLEFHHRHNANEIMTARGAKRWMYHMRAALNKYKGFSDPRIKPCIMTFLKTKMQTYASDFGWEFDASDFELDSFTDQVRGDIS